MQNLILGGVLRGIFTIQGSFVPWESILELFGQKWPARIMAVKLLLTKISIFYSPSFQEFLNHLDLLSSPFWDIFLDRWKAKTCQAYLYSHLVFLQYWEAPWICVIFRSLEKFIQVNRLYISVKTCHWDVGDRF